MNILIIDDHDLFRQGLGQAIQVIEQPSSIQQAASVVEAQVLIHQHHQTLNLVLLDYTLPDRNGLDFLMELQQQYPLLPVALISAHEDISLMKKTLDRGAMGFIPKSTPIPVLLTAIQLILAGGVYIPPTLYQRSQAQPHTIKLTARQQEVFTLLCQGYANKEIAYRLHISDATVKAHVTVILKAKGVTSRQMLIAKKNTEDKF